MNGPQVTHLAVQFHSQNHYYLLILLHKSITFYDEGVHTELIQKFPEAKS